ncbi:PepSY domain-containing protein [Hydrogenovibrio sp. 3SP14C1]|uniref:PepSY domain-containing protein n=1 Tax=Hydrogenovibrio sp. 3SP14C1 TaxID=3038774 RepID=UPI0024163B33|nr:PepSY domain-containing protein [Hydrogenovibrio sp. 3SP14C1]MDG4812879.1 PepSY domain-containing protein [Hydrogenovibrio sp. 3SP14C1]
MPALFKKHTARQFHRLLAYTVAFLLFWLSLSGVLLNHTEDLKLNDVKIQQPWLLEWYQINTPKIQQAFQLKADWVIQTPQALYWNKTPLPFQGNIRALVSNDSFLFILLSNKLILLTNTGDFIERIPLPEALQSQNVTDPSNLDFFTQQNHVILAAKNSQAWQISEDFTQLIPIQTDAQASWIKLTIINSQAAPEDIQKQLMNSFDSPLTLEKIILELHNGYFFGKVGPWLVDLASLLFILMVLSGIRLHLKK